MKIAVLGSGVIGTTTAYYLSKLGHEVTVYDRQDGPALETSFANAGEISPGYASPWAAPGVPMKALKWLFMHHAPLIVRPHLDVATLVWLARLLRNCTAERYALNKARMVRVAEYSRDCLIALRAETGITYDERTRGTLQLFRYAKQVDGAAKDIEVLTQGGVPFEVLDPEGCVAAEPALAKVRDKIAGGLRLPHDETGDCYKFTNALAAIAAAQGVHFVYGRSVSEIEVAARRIIQVQTSTGPISADAYVVALGSYTPHVLAPLGIHLPIYPVKGYSLTVPIIDPSRAPVSTVMDETYKIAITRLGDRVRIGGMAEISGFSNDLPPARRETLEHSARDLFGGSGDFTKAAFWSGLRPMTPDGTPIVGATPYPNLFVNSGHGTLGWTMACGSGKAIADLITSRTPEIETADLGLQRYH